MILKKWDMQYKEHIIPYQSNKHKMKQWSIQFYFVKTLIYTLYIKLYIKYIYTYLYLCICIHIYVCVYVYILREREEEEKERGNANGISVRLPHSCSSHTADSVTCDKDYDSLTLLLEMYFKILIQFIYSYNLKDS